MNLQDVIIAPLITEKNQDLEKIGEGIGKRTVKYVFNVHPEANKTLIKQAIRKYYDKTPDDVNVMVYKGKTTKFRNKSVRKAHWKKAIVTFNDGTTLELAKVG